MGEWRDKRKSLNEGWVPGRSAWETANAWVGSGGPILPHEFRELLSSQAQTDGLALDRGIVEAKTPLRYGSGPRNHDILLSGRKSGTGCIVIGVESKADDGFKETIKSQLLLAATKREGQQNTNLDRRCDWLSHCLMGISLLNADRSQISSGDEEHGSRDEILDLPYQLFAGVAGTMLEAKEHGAAAAVFAVHQFKTQFTIDDNIDTDNRLFDRFVTCLINANRAPDLNGSRIGPLRYGKLLGPIYFSERDCGDKRWNIPHQVALFIGKIETDRLAI